MRRTTTAYFCLALLVGCTTPPTAEEIASADIGEQPTQAEAERLALQLLAADELTPEHFSIEFSPVRRNWYRASGFADPRFGWQLDARVEARERKRRSADGVGLNQFFWVHGRCVARAYYTRHFDGSRSRTFLPLDAPRTPSARIDVAETRPPEASATAATGEARIDTLLVRRATLRRWRIEAEAEPEQREAIDLLLETVARQLTAAGYTGH